MPDSTELSFWLKRHFLGRVPLKHLITTNMIFNFEVNLFRLVQSSYDDNVIKIIARTNPGAIFICEVSINADIDDVRGFVWHELDLYLPTGESQGSIFTLFVQEIAPVIE